MKRVLVGIVALGALAMGGGSALADHQTENEAVALYNKASSQVGREKVCRPEFGPATVTHDPPSQELLSTLGILRRPATPEDVLSHDQLRFFPFMKGVYVDYVRIAHTADGREYQIIPAQNARAFPAESHACLHRVHVHLRRLSKGKPERVRRRALHFYNQRARNDRRLAKNAPQEGVFVFSHGPNGAGGGGGGGGAGYIRTHGEFGSSGTRQRDQAVVSGLIPDGVATVTSFFSRRAPRAPGRRPKDYGKPIERTDRVQDNMISFELARDAEDAFPAKMIWRAADGSIVRVIRNPQ